jgi:hypothetical protein
MASLISLGFRSSKYAHPTRDEETSKAVAPKGWVPIRVVIAVAEEQQRRRPLATQLQNLALHHCLESRRTEVSIIQYSDTVTRFRPSGIKRELRRRQTLPAFQG